jgi:chemotaxis protein methyltransferase CheR
MADELDEMLSPLEYRLLCELIYEYCGIRFEEPARYMVTRRLWPRVRALGLSSFTDYYRHLKYSPKARAELDELVERVTTNETYFFREDYQLRAFTDELIPILVPRNAEQQHLRIWSAGCSSGEEGYTIAMLCREHKLLAGWDVEIFGNDISKKVLGMARAARYPQSAFRSTDKRYIDRYFRPAEGGKLEVVDEIKKLVTFGHLNLLDSVGLSLVGQNDVIFCRNVMIYFDEAARKIVLRNLFKRLRPGGYLLLGHSESLLNVSTEFEIVSLKNDLVYRRPM